MIALARRCCAPILAALLLPGLPAVAAAPAILQAEAGKLPTGAEVKKDAEALGGEYVFQPQDYYPLFTQPVPEKGNTFTIWARGRGHGICLKTKSDDGKQRELKWLFKWPAEEWTWRTFGTWHREDLGEAIVFIRQPNAEPGAGLDAIVISNDPEYVPPGADKPSPQALKPPPRASADAPTEETAVLQGDRVAPEDRTPVAAKATIDWSEKLYPISRDIFSVAIFAGFDPEVAADPAYAKGLAYMQLPLVRYHNSNMIDDSTDKGVGWVDYKNKRWDAEKIVKALTAWNPPGVRKVITIPNWPSWMDADGDKFLDADQYEAFAAFCAELVRIINVENDFAIPFFEITNERDGLYWVNREKNGEPDKLDELVKIYNLCAKAMKAVDPSIKTGGPAATRPDYIDHLRRFAKATLGNLDFLSAHGYASGKTTDSDASIYSKTRNLGQHMGDLRVMLDELSPERRVPIHLNEYNISWTWETREPRMIDHKGAVFDALCFVEFARHRLEVSNAWNERDGIYGKMSKEYELRPGAHVFHYVNDWMMGDAVKVDASEPGKVVVFASRDGDGRGILVVNRTDVENTLTLDIPESGAPWKMATIDATGLATSEKANPSETLTLPPHSVTFLRGAPPEAAPAE